MSRVKTMSKHVLSYVPIISYLQLLLISKWNSVNILLSYNSYNSLLYTKYNTSTCVQVGWVCMLIALLESIYNIMQPTLLL